MKRRRAVRVTIFCLLTALLLELTGSFLTMNSAHGGLRLQGFYLEEENSLDVVLMGTSNLYTGFSSALAYEEYGFTSYPYAVDENPVSLYVRELREILRTQPQARIVIEIDGLLYGKASNLYSDAHLGRFVDNIPLSLNKLATIAQDVPVYGWYKYLFPLARYHSNWNKIAQCLQYRRDLAALKNNGFSLLKGLTTYTASAAQSGTIDPTGYSALPLSADSEKALRELLTFCRENNLSVLFYKSPRRVTTNSLESYRREASAAALIEEYGYRLVNCDAMSQEEQASEIGLDWDTDFYSDEHMNVYGMEKFTKYLGAVIQDAFGLWSCSHTDETTARWNEAVSATDDLLNYAKGCLESDTSIWLYETADVMARLPKDSA